MTEHMPADHYDRDILVWSERPAELLRRLAAGEWVNADIDWAHVIDGVQDVGHSELHACESLISQALIHLLKLHGWPDAQSVAHWRGETATFLARARRYFSPSMQQRISVPDIFAEALYAVRAGIDPGDPPQPFPEL